MRAYGYLLQEFPISVFETPFILPFAQWAHPLEVQKTFTDADFLFYRQLIPPGSHVIDIGAFTGDTAVIYAVCAGRSGLVHAFEPNDLAGNILAANIHLLEEYDVPAARIIHYGYAVMPHPGSYTFSYVDEGRCNGGYRADHTEHGILDDFRHKKNVIGRHLPLQILANIDFLKIDTEGIDYEILTAHREFLDHRKPIVQFEIYPHMENRKKQQLCALMRDIGYCLFFRDSEELVEWHGGNYPLDLFAIIPLREHTL